MLWATNRTSRLLTNSTNLVAPADWTSRNAIRPFRVWEIRRKIIPTWDVICSLTFVIHPQFFTYLNPAQVEPAIADFRSPTPNHARNEDCNKKNPGYEAPVFHFSLFLPYTSWHQCVCFENLEYPVTAAREHSPPQLRVLSLQTALRGHDGAPENFFFKRGAAP